MEKIKEVIYFESQEGQIVISARITELKLLKLKFEAEIKRRKADIRNKSNIGSNTHYVYNPTTGLNKKLAEIKRSIDFNCALLMRTNEHEYQLEN